MLIGGSTEVTESSDPSIDDLIVPAVGTIYADWNGDCEITTAELLDLKDAVDEEEYNPLYDYNCDGELTTAIERAAASANYITQPPCGEESLMGGGGDESSYSSLSYEMIENAAALAAWLESTMSSSELDAFIDDLTEAAENFSGTSIGFEMMLLLVVLQAE